MDSCRGVIKQHMGIWRDLRVKRRKTEVYVQVGRIVAVGREEGVPIPVNAAALEVVHEMEAGERGMSWSDLAKLPHRSRTGSSTA